MDTNKKPISEVMTRTVCEVTTDFSAAQVLELMHRESVSSVLVVEDRLTLGIVTERDVVRNLHRVGSLKTLSCADLMQAPVITVEASENCLDVYHLMGSRRIRHLAVTDAEGLLVGIVSEGDILRDFGVEYYLRFKDVGGAMTADVCLLPESATVAEVVTRMDEGRYSCVFAVDAARRPLGVLTERDIVRLCHQQDNPDRMLLGQAMSKPVKFARTDDLLHEAVKVMANAGIRRLAVVDHDDKVCGVLTHHEVVSGLEGQYVSYLKEMVQRQEKALQCKQEVVDEKQFLETVLRSMPATAVLAADLAYRVTYCNPAVTTILKLQCGAVLGQDIHDVLASVGWPDSAPILTQQALRDAKPHKQALDWIAGTQQCRAELVVSLLIDEQDQPQGYLLLAR
jgi:CBS domain-containing protein